MAEFEGRSPNLLTNDIPKGPRGWKPDGTGRPLKDRVSFRGGEARSPVGGNTLRHESMKRRRGYRLIENSGGITKERTYRGGLSVRLYEKLDRFREKNNDKNWDRKTELSEMIREMNTDVENFENEAGKLEAKARKLRTTAEDYRSLIGKAMEKIDNLDKIENRKDRNKSVEVTNDVGYDSGDSDDEGGVKLEEQKIDIDIKARIQLSNYKRGSTNRFGTRRSQR